MSYYPRTKLCCVDTLNIIENLIMSTSSYGQREPMENDAMERTMREDGYAAWLIPSISARVTEETKKIAASAGR